jgi:hypothetical protein
MTALIASPGWAQTSAYDPMTAIEAEGTWRGVIEQCASPADKAYLLAKSSQFVSVEARSIQAEDVDRLLQAGFSKVPQGIPCNKQDIPGLRRKFDARAETVDPLIGQIVHPTQTDTSNGAHQ